GRRRNTDLTLIRSFASAWVSRLDNANEPSASICYLCVHRSSTLCAGGSPTLGPCSAVHCYIFLACLSPGPDVYEGSRIWPGLVAELQANLPDRLGLSERGLTKCTCACRTEQ